jgi:hypothetical protein
MWVERTKLITCCANRKGVCAQSPLPPGSLLSGTIYALKSSIRGERTHGVFVQYRSSCIPLRTIDAKGDVADALLELIKRERFDTIIMGRRGATRLKR